MSVLTCFVPPVSIIWIAGFFYYLKGGFFYWKSLNIHLLVLLRVLAATAYFQLIFKTRSHKMEFSAHQNY
ncbi:hypothetical protein CW304_24865 [Bacillus sp. UFRGS-B20]|nr:hypothetical protein CW304_24865 [Bacillus sp. UFRGS-B20]